MASVPAAAIVFASVVVASELFSGSSGYGCRGFPLAVAAKASPMAMAAAERQGMLVENRVAYRP